VVDLRALCQAPQPRSCQASRVHSPPSTRRLHGAPAAACSWPCMRSGRQRRGVWLGRLSCACPAARLMWRPARRPRWRRWGRSSSARASRWWPPSSLTTSTSGWPASWCARAPAPAPRSRHTGTRPRGSGHRCCPAQLFVRWTVCGIAFAAGLSALHACLRSGQAPVV